MNRGIVYLTRPYISFNKTWSTTYVVIVNMYRINDFLFDEYFCFYCCSCIAGASVGPGEYKNTYLPSTSF